MRSNKLREKLNAGEPTLATHIHTTWPSVVEALGHTGAYDYVEFVAEYAPFDLHDLDNLARRRAMGFGNDDQGRCREPRLCGPTGHRVGFRQRLFADVRETTRGPVCAACAPTRPGTKAPMG